MSRDWLVGFLEHRIGDKRVIRLIVKWLNAGVMEDGEWRDDLRGTPQGSGISPTLANVYLHYVLDLWFHKKWRSREVNGESIIVRYADDFVVGFQHKRDAERFLSAVKERFRKFELEIHPDKTRLIEFGRFANECRRERGQGRPETFDFLGFTHYCAETRRGSFMLGRKPVAKRMARTLRRIKGALRKRMHEDIRDTARWLGQVVDGWLNYFAVPTSYTIPGALRRTPHAHMGSNSAASLAERPNHMGQHPTPEGAILAQADNPPPVAEPTIYRQRHRERNPREEPDALAGTPGSVRGAPGNRVPTAINANQAVRREENLFGAANP